MFDSYSNIKKGFICCFCYMFKKIIICLVCSFCVWQKILQCLGSERDILWELHRHKLHKECDTRRSRCSSVVRNKDVLFYQQWRLLFPWNASRRQCSRTPNTSTISFSIKYEIGWRFYLAIGVHMLWNYCCQCCLREFVFNGDFVRLEG